MWLLAIVLGSAVLEGKISRSWWLIFQFGVTRWTEIQLQGQIS